MARQAVDRQPRRYRHFVGRSAELAVVQSALTAEVLPFQTLFVYGPGGIGKTALLRETQYTCQQLDIPAAYIDARHLEPAPQALLRSVTQAFGLAGDDDPAQALAWYSRRHVILIDT